jgi:hypothetical protein
MEVVSSSTFLFLDVRTISMEEVRLMGDEVFSTVSFPISWSLESFE